MLEIPDLRTSTHIASGRVGVAAGELIGAPSLGAALDRAATQVAGRPPAAGGHFRLDLDSAGRANIEVADAASLARLRMLLAGATLELTEPGVVLRAEQSAAFAERAVLECFYGPLWNPADRAAVVDAAADAGANVYVYGPAGDRRTGGAWRESYAGAARADLEQLTAHAHSRGMRAIWRVSPAAPLEPTQAIRVSSPDEMQTLICRAQDALGLGFDGILIAFDDIPEGLDPDTRAANVGARHPLAAAHATAVNTVAAAVGAERIIACPTHYWGVDPSTYRQQFGEILAPGIPVVWTGPTVISDHLGADQARAVADELGHPLWIWDNYPVNDWDTDPMGAHLAGPEGLGDLIAPRRLPLAPLLGRDARLGEVAVAYGNDLAIDAHTGIPAMRTALDFAWDGGSYDADRSWRWALDRSGLDPAAVALLGDAAGPVSGGGRRRPSQFAAACAAALIASPDDRPAALTALEQLVDAHAAAVHTLRASAEPLAAELKPWLDELGRQCAFALLASRTLRAERPQAGPVPLRLREALAQPSRVSVASGAGRMLAEFARGLVAGGEPAIPS